MANKLITLDNLKEFKTKIDEENLINITYSSLKSLRDNSQLKKGKWYRITDYVTTTGQANTRSAGHQFDIVVFATASNELSEIAKAIIHSGDTYFSKAHLNAWKIKYCLDNDTTRFNWATSSGKGVIWFMEDEWGNQAPYDFKNIQFELFQITGSGVLDDDLEYWYYWATPSHVPNGYSIDEQQGSEQYCYTFHDGYKDQDASLSLNINEGMYPDQDGVYNNVINEYHVFSQIDNENGYKVLSLNYIIILCRYDNGIENPVSIFNIFGVDNHDIIIGSLSRNNTFGSDCYSNTFGSDCYSNTFGNYCYSNTFGSSCDSNTFGSSCDSNTFGNYCYYNTFGSSCDSNTFGSDCYSNTFGIKVNNTKTTIDYCRYIIIDNGCNYLNITCSDTSATSSNYLQNIHIHLGVQGSSSSYKTITVSDRNLSYEINYIPTGTKEISV